MSGEPLSDERLMIGVQRGDRSAYEALYGRWRDRLFAFLLKRTGGVPEAEEALQEAWLRVYRWRDRYDGERPFKPWLYTIVANAGRDAYRPRPTLFELPPEPGEPASIRDLVVSALSALDPEERRLMLLTIEGFDGPEIAQMLGISPDAARARLHRARERMKARVREADDA